MGIFEYLKRLIQELIDFNKTGVVERGNQKAVTGGAVYDYLAPTTTTSGYTITKSGRVVQINCDNIRIDQLQTIASDLRPTSNVLVIGKLYNTSDQTKIGHITIKTDGTFEVKAWFDFNSIGTPVANSTYVTFNTSYIID